jgi:hypothetical protein
MIKPLCTSHPRDREEKDGGGGVIHALLASAALRLSLFLFFFAVCWFHETLNSFASRCGLEQFSYGSRNLINPQDF